MAKKSTKVLRTRIVNKLETIIGGAEGTRAKDFAEKYAKDSWARVTVNCTLLDREGSLPESLQGDGKADERLSIKAAMMLAWAISDSKEHKEQMKEWLVDKELAEIETAVRGLWGNHGLKALLTPNNLAGKMRLLNDPDNTLNFMKVYALGPGSGVALPAAASDQILGFKRWNTADLRVHAKLQKADNQVFCLKWNISDDGDAPVHYYLPWADKRITKVTLDNNVDSPRLFFTDHLKGCSVFIQGPATTPTIYHAGFTGAFPGGLSLNQLSDDDPLGADPAPPAKALLQADLVNVDRVQGACHYWHHLVQYRAGLTDVQMGAVAEVNKTHYDHRDADDHPDQLEPVYTRIGLVLTRKGKDIDQIEEGLGCVFGIRGGAGWTFYLQKKAMLKTYNADGNNVIVSVPVFIERIFPLPAALMWDGRAQLLPIKVSDNDITYSV